MILKNDENRQKITSLEQEIIDLRARVEVLQTAAHSQTDSEKNRLQPAADTLNFYENAHQGILFTNIHNDIIYANPHFLKMMSSSDAAELLDSLPPEIIALFRDIRENGAVRERELHLVNKNGAGVSVICSGVSCHDDAGNFQGTQIIFSENPDSDSLRHDIIPHSEIEKALREGEQRYRELFEGIDDAVFVHDEQANILDVNEAVCRRLGYSREELLRMKVTDIDAPEYAEGFQDRLREQLEKGGLSKIDIVHVTHDGRRINADVNTRRITYQGQTAILAVVRDITELRQSEQKYRELFITADRQRQELTLLDRVRVILAHQLDLPTVFRTVVEAIADIKQSGRDVLLVSSGAVGLGAER